MLDLQPSLATGRSVSPGLQVAALWADGHFYPGVLQSVIMRANVGDNLYMVSFGDGYQKEFTEGEIVTGGTRDMSHLHLKFNQKVFIDHNGREIVGFVQKHRKQTNEVFIKLSDSEETLVRRKLHDICLLPAAMRTRDFISINDRCSNLNNSPMMREVMEPKKRMVTTIANGNNSPSAKTQKFPKEEEPAMSEVMAAMILTSLHTAQPMEYATGFCSVSLSAPCSPLSISPEPCTSSPSPSASSGHFSWDLNSRGTPSPGLSISDAESSSSGSQMTVGFPPPQCTPAESMPGALVFSSSVDEGIDMSSDYSPRSRDWDQSYHSPKKLKIQSPSRTLYKCTWQNCTKTLCSVQGIERHIRTVHLGKKENDFSDHEEEFYYTEIESTMEAFSNTFASMMTSSPPPFDRTSGGQTSPHAKPSQAFFPTTSHVTQQCNMNQSARQSPNSTSLYQAIPSHDQRMEPVVPRKPPAHERVRHHSGSPPSRAQLQLAGLSCAARIRAEGRKCRKVYGMGHRNLWCTQCKWKKACTRFM